jgi:hypothetical protein
MNGRGTFLGTLGSSERENGRWEVKIREAGDLGEDGVAIFGLNAARPRDVGT